MSIFHEYKYFASFEAGIALVILALNEWNIEAINSAIQQHKG